MKNKKKIVVIVIVVIIFAMALINFFVIRMNYNRYDINKSIFNFNINNKIEKNKYVDYLKQYVYPQKLRLFINNDYINFDQYKNEVDGNFVLKQIEFNGYKRLFYSLFDKERVDFEDCPVTENFKEKFNTNLLNYFNLVESEDCESNCLLNREDKEITVEVYGNFKNTEPTYWTTHHFHYTLDDEGNVDDVVFDYTEK